MKINKKIIVFASLLIAVFIFVFCKPSSNWAYLKIPLKYVTQFEANSKKVIIAKTDVFAIVDELPLNYVKDASVDYTELIQKALDNHRNVVFPNFPILINSKGLSISSNSILYFDENSSLHLMPNKYGQYEIIRIHDVENVIIYGANIIGDKESHTAKDGEWGMGVSIRGAKNIKLYNTIVKSCWGDGIYLGITNTSSKNVNVTITNTLLDSNRRNGMSIIAAENLNVKDLIVANTHGTPPSAGVDIEPDANTDIIKNLNFDGIISFNNETHGFLFALNNMAGELQHNDVNINVKRFKAIYGEIGMSFKMGQSQKNMKVPKGLISIDTPQFSSLSRIGFLSYDDNEFNTINVKIKTDTNDFEKSKKAFKGAKNILLSK